ncbi:MAG: zinc-finger domain-containing protein [Thiohalophilus sp.]|nr:zinc-finger domain-containing protein [Thiohalophilus sp.]MDR9437353.1 zinc-finger domain-containing protein [Thiohalophilus sp.]MDY6978554.1 zinc-finger domain-containing protein [Pseudomonadota bacterium]
MNQKSTPKSGQNSPAARKPVQANAASRYEVTRAELPLHCPMDDMTLWNSHPRVYLPIEEQGGEAKCPYCGAVYILKDL